MVVEQHEDFLQAYYSDSIDSKDQAQDQEGGERERERERGVMFAREEGLGLYMQLLQATTTTTTHITGTATASGSGRDQPPRERGRERAFLRGLLHPDPSHRDSVGEACDALFLLQGDPHPLPIATSTATATAAPTPIALDPLALHHQVTPLVQLPCAPTRHQTSGSGGNEEDEQGDSGDNNNPWARRQFSVLWAPMPADYDTDADGTSRGPAEGCSLGAEGSRRAYTLTRLQETAVELNAPFLG